MPSSDNRGPQQPAQTFFPTRRSASSPSATPSQLQSTTIVFNPGLETPEEAFMRLGVTGPVPDKQLELEEQETDPERESQPTRKERSEVETPRPVTVSAKHCQSILDDCIYGTGKAFKSREGVSSTGTNSNDIPETYG